MKDTEKRSTKGWKKLTLNERVEVLHMLLELGFTQSKIARIIGKNPNTVHRLVYTYCDVKITKTVRLKPEKKAMARLLEAKKQEPKIPGL